MKPILLDASLLVTRNSTWQLDDGRYVTMVWRDGVDYLEISVGKQLNLLYMVSDEDRSRRVMRLHVRPGTPLQAYERYLWRPELLVSDRRKWIGDAENTEPE